MSIRDTILQRLGLTESAKLDAAIKERDAAIERAMQSESMRDALIETAKREGDIVVDGQYVELHHPRIQGRIIVTRGASNVGIWCATMLDAKVEGVKLVTTKEEKEAWFQKTSQRISINDELNPKE